jgi:predicted ATPase
VTIIGRDEAAPVDHAFAPGLFVLTGAPGTGKSAILNRLRGAVRCVDEPAREILAEQRSSGGAGTWDRDRSLFVQLLLQRSIEKYEAAIRSGGKVLFDRGVPDCAVYAIRAGADPEPSLAAAGAFRYGPEVLFLEPWRDIYATDDERIMPFDDTVLFSQALRDVYTRSGYRLVEVPQTSIDDRVAFVHTFVSSHIPNRA